MEEVNRISHRPYCTGFFYGDPREGSETQNADELTNGGQYYADSGYMREYDFVGTIDRCAGGIMSITQRNYFTVTDELAILVPGREPIRFVPEKLFNSQGEQIEVARHAMERLTAVSNIEVPDNSILRKRVK